jgi:phenylacetate-CoA ligase
MDVSAEPQEQLAWLRNTQADYLLSYPSNLELLASLVSENGFTFPQLKKIQTISEALAPRVQQLIELAFGVQVCDTYSCNEAGYVASTCPSGHGYHVHSENIVLEVLNEQDIPCKPGETGRVVLTTLHNFATPFIRYDIHDEAECGPYPCPCGRTLPTLTRIYGKRRPMLRLPGGRLKNSTALAIAIRSTERVQQFQVVQGFDDQIRVKIIPKPPCRNEDLQMISAIVCEFFESQIPIAIEFVSRIEPSKSGKVLDFIVEAPRA